MSTEKFRIIDIGEQFCVDIYLRFNYNKRVNYG